MQTTETTTTETVERDVYNDFHGPEYDLVVDAALRKAWATADYLVFRFHEIHGMPSYHRDAREVTIRATYRSRGGAETAREWRTRGYVRAGYFDQTETRGSVGGADAVRYSDDPSNVYTPPSGAGWAVSVLDSVRSIVESLPIGSKIKVRAMMDYGTNGYMAAARLHGDQLRVTATWTRGSREHQREFVLDEDVLPHNSARFGVSS